MRNHLFYYLLAGAILLGSCIKEQLPPPDPCEENPGSTIAFGNLIYQFNEKGWPIYVTTNDVPAPGILGSSYRFYRWYGGHNLYTEMQLNNGTVWEWDSLACDNLYDCQYVFDRSYEPCPVSGQYEPCELNMTLKQNTQYAETYGDVTHYYSPPQWLDSIVSPDFKKVFHYTNNRPVRMTEYDSNGDSVATEYYGIDQDGRWLEYEKVNHVTGHITYIGYTVDADSRLLMVSVGQGQPPLTVTDYPATHTGCGELPRLLDPLNFHRMPYKRLPYIGIPW